MQTKVIIDLLSKVVHAGTLIWLQIFPSRLTKNLSKKNKEAGAGARRFAYAAIFILLIAISGVAVYFVVASQTKTNKFSVESLSVVSSTSNLTAYTNVKTISPLTSMSLFVNGSFVGSYNYTSGKKECCLRLSTTWSNGTSSFLFTATPASLPKMNDWNWTVTGSASNRSYLITMVATFANKSSLNSTAIIVANKQGTGWTLR